MKPTPITDILNKKLSNNIEKWMPIPNFESLYEVSSFGEIKSLPRKTHNQFSGGRILKQLLSKDGYRIISLSKNSKRRTYLVHRLVADVFISNPNNLPQVNHINSLKTENRVENLEWVSIRENSHHMFKNVKKSSKYIGVHWSNTENKWISKLMLNKKSITIGSFDKEEDAHKAHIDKLKELNIYSKYI